MSIPASEAKSRLIEGNKRFINATSNPGDVSLERRVETLKNGQYPYAIVLCCSDSRQIPEAIFSAGIGELFVIRVAGNATCLNVKHSVKVIEENTDMKLLEEKGLEVIGAVYHLEDGHVEFLE